jgi:hypothetical protein
MTATFDHRGRRYRVVAKFTGDNRAAEAKGYVDTHTHVRVLCDEDGEAIVVADRDFGLALDNVDSGFDTKGWTNILLPKL